MRLLGMLFVLVLMAGVIYCFIKYFQFWKRFEFPAFLYWIVQAVLFGLLIYCAGGIPGVKNEVVRSILLRISAIYLVILMYSVALVLLRQLFCILGEKMEMKNRVYQFFHSTKKGIGSILIFTLTLGIISLINEQYTVHTQYEVSGIVEENQKLRIAVVADAHIGTGVLRSSLEKMGDRINAAEPDLVFLVGDFFDNSSIEPLRQAMVKELAEIKSRYGVYYVEGNHEVYLNEDTARYFREAGVQVLSDQVTTLPNGVQIAGRRDFSNKEQLPLEKVLEGTDPDQPMILLSHQPQELALADQLGVDLVFCGHTHGGQLWGNIGTYLMNDMNYGEKKFGNMTAITTSGIGVWGVPAKLGFPSEIVVVDLYP